MARFQVDSAEVQTAAAQVRTTAGAVRTEVGTMMAHLLTLQTTWTGTAASSFTTCSEQWRALQSQVEANLDEISLALDSAARGYEDAETAAHGMFAV
ncbi:MAG: WXG100 family type VII secretion target [Actinomycetaceae bacterium]|jgi:WXG100 family type VII secretion target